MIERLSHRDLRNRSAQVLRDVAAGATYEVTNHGQVVAVLSAPTMSGLRVRKATSRRPFSEIRRVRRSESTQAVLDELRGES